MDLPRRSPARTKEVAVSLYDVPVNRLDGTPADLSDYDDKLTLVVNVASRPLLVPAMLAPTTR